MSQANTVTHPGTGETALSWRAMWETRDKSEHPWLKILKGEKAAKATDRVKLITKIGIRYSTKCTRRAWRNSSSSSSCQTSMRTIEMPPQRQGKPKDAIGQGGRRRRRRQRPRRRTRRRRRRRRRRPRIKREGRACQTRQEAKDKCQDESVKVGQNQALPRNDRKLLIHERERILDRRALKGYSIFGSKRRMR